MSAHIPSSLIREIAMPRNAATSSALYVILQAIDGLGRGQPQGGPAFCSEGPHALFLRLRPRQAWVRIDVGELSIQLEIPLGVVALEAPCIRGRHDLAVAFPVEVPDFPASSRDQ